MCNIGEALFKEGEAKGKAKGKAEGIKIGVKKGKAEGIEIGVKKGEKKGIVKGLLRAIVSIVKHYGVTNEQAMANLGIPENEYEKYNKLLEKGLSICCCLVYAGGETEAVRAFVLPLLNA